MKNIIKKIPSVILFTLMTAIYLTCGYLFGYHQGYLAGQKDYIVYINEILETAKQTKIEDVKN